MSKRGRPRKPGRRKNGRPIPLTAEQRFVRGNDKAEARKALYGTEGGDPIGRAYVMGLLGEGNQAKDRKDMARKFARIWARVFARPYRCALNDSPRGSENVVETDFGKAQEEWMRNNRDAMDMACSVFFDQLVLPASPLDDPHWLASLFAGDKGVNDTYAKMMAMAVEAIDALEHNPRERERKALDFPVKLAYGLVP